MVDVSVCVGSSCHLKGSYQIIQRLRQLITAYHLTDQVRLSGSFCLSSCGNGVTIKIDGCLFHTTPDDIETLFNEQVKSALEV